MNEPILEISPDADTLAEQLADWIVQRIGATTGPFALNLSGGSTPKRTYSLLATERHRRRIDWERVHLFFGDERFVPKDHPDSNFRMVREALISKVPIPEENVYPVETESGEPDDAAAAYEETLKRYYGKVTLDLARPLFGATILGLGEDGHTASLFPGTAALLERSRWVTAVVGVKPEPRVSMTYPTLNSSAALLFLVSGSGKSAMLARLLKRDSAIPAAKVAPQGDFLIFCDDAAMALG